MNRRVVSLIGGLLLAGSLIAGSFAVAAAQTPGPGFGRGYGPGGGYGPGMMGGGYGYGYGPGMMGGYGYGYGPGGMMRGSWATAGTGTPLASLADAQKAFQSYLDSLGNSDLKLDEVMEFQWNYYAIVKEASTGNGAFELLADKQTGAVFPEPGPNMMWNTKYGHMAGVWAAPSAQPSVTADKAKEIAQQWLDTNQPGSSVETPDAFPGYYTVHILKDGKVTGMLSVNAFTGQVWFHTWHGAFVATSESGS